MMNGMWSSPPVHAEDRVRAPADPGSEPLRDAFFRDIRPLTLGLVRGERWRLRLGPVTLLRFGEPVRADGAWSWPITGGLLARRPGGRLTYGWRAGELTGGVDGYVPRLPPAIHR